MRDVDVVNKVNGDCEYSGTFVPNQYYTYNITAKLNNQAFSSKIKVVFISGKVFPFRFVALSFEFLSTCIKC
jgi:hypothetical protein